jgi:hypothetical protein
MRSPSGAPLRRHDGENVAANEGGAAEDGGPGGVDALGDKIADAPLPQRAAAGAARAVPRKRPQAALSSNPFARKSKAAKQ